MFLKTFCEQRRVCEVNLAERHHTPNIVIN